MQWVASVTRGAARRSADSGAAAGVRVKCYGPGPASSMCARTHDRRKRSVLRIERAKSMQERRRNFTLQDPTRTKSTAFTREERDEMGLRGLLPHHVSTMESQVGRSLASMRRKAYDIERYIFLCSLQDRNERLFYRLVIDNIEETMPLIYTPTVGQACKEYGQIFRQSRGFYITPDDRGTIRGMLDNWSEDDVRVIVVTDGERILGLGDLGSNGMGIPIGKLALYSACGGIPPEQCLPVMFDVGTHNEELLNDPLYLGYRRPRLGGDEYLELMDEFVAAIQDRFPSALIQFEDFLTPNAYRLLDRYRDKVLCFNDDIQGTAAVALAGVLAATRVTGDSFRDMRIMFLGAGSAATGIGDLMVTALCAEGLSEREARERLWFVDKDGQVVKSRTDLMAHNIPYAHDEPQRSFIEAIGAHKPHVLIGATGAPGTFTEEALSKVASHHERPVVLALSNPTSRAECTAEDAYRWTGGRALFASGSPFGTVAYKGRAHRPGQGNNAYVFPGIGLGALASNANRLDDASFLTAARALCGTVTTEDLDEGALYPRLTKLRSISAAIAVEVASELRANGLAPKSSESPEQLRARIEESMYDPRY